MKNDLSFINTEADLDKAIQLVQNRITYSGIQIKEEVKQLPGILMKQAVSKSKYLIAGSISAGLAALLFKKRPVNQMAEPVAKNLSVTLTTIALRSLPIAGILLRKWLQHRQYRKEKTA